MKKSEKIAEINNKLQIAIASEKTKLTEAEVEYRKRVTSLLAKAQIKREEATDDPEEQQNCDQPTVRLNGEQWTAIVVARRILKKLPKIPYNCSIDLSLNHYTENGVSLQIKAYNPHREENSFESLWLYEHDEPEKQAADISEWLERAEKLLACKPDNDHVAEPIVSALDSFFGGNPVNEIPTIDRKEDGNE